MRFLLLALGVLALGVAGCGGPPMGKVKGQIFENGQPKSFPPASHAVEIAAVNASGEADPTKTFTAVVNEDGTFEMLASGGQLPAGTYAFTVRGAGTKKGAAPPKASKREIHSGDNQITLDLAKPGE